MSSASASSTTPPSRLDQVLVGTPIAMNNVSATSSSSSSSASPSSDTKLTNLPSHLDILLPSSPSLVHLLLHIASSVTAIHLLLRSMTVASLGSDNAFGDHQLNVDIASHDAVLKYLRLSGVCATASSEEDPMRLDISDCCTRDARDQVRRDASVRCRDRASAADIANEPDAYSVSFDPLDGSSIIDANFAVGSIFSVFRGREFIGQTVGEQAACAIAQYGPRTTIMFGLPPNNVFEATLMESDNNVDPRWIITRRNVALKPNATTFAPANLRCTAENDVYKKLVQHYMDKQYTLRYSGGLVPDVYHSLIKGQGIFMSPTSRSCKAKLRLLYECAAVGMLVKYAGGSAVNEYGEELSMAVVKEYDQRSGLIVGSINEVERYKQHKQTR